jgi:hypothetical protein
MMSEKTASDARNYEFNETHPFVQKNGPHDAKPRKMTSLEIAPTRKGG